MLKPIKSETDQNNALERTNFIMDKSKSKSDYEESETKVVFCNSGLTFLVYTLV